VIDRTSLGPQYELQLAAKNVPLHDAVHFGRALGVHALQGIGATGSVTTTLRLSGSAWPPARPVLTARAEMRAARLLIPGLTEPLNLPRASCRFRRSNHADPVIAVLGTSVFMAHLSHHGARVNPWKFDLRANRLALEQGALWFDALGLRRPLPLLERLPGLASFRGSARSGRANLLAAWNAEGRFATPALSYRGVILGGFQGTFDLAGRIVRMSAATFRAEGGRGTAAGMVDFTLSPPLLSAQVSLSDVPAKALTERLPGPVSNLRGSMSASGDFHTRGLAREELAENLTGQMELRLRDISFGDFDPLGTLAEQSHWGKLDAVRGPVTAPPTILDVEIRDRSFVLKSLGLDLSGASLEIDGTYAWTGAMTLNVRADLRRLRRRWLARDDSPQPSELRPEVRLGGPIDHLVVNPQAGVARAGTYRGGERLR